MKAEACGEERLYLSLKELYESLGYARFKMRRFEEYSLYADNFNFLRSRDVITFGDKNGRLLALKPDVTLSIVKGCTGGKGLKKVYYRESVYRPDRPGGQFREINQIGLECVGDVDEYVQTEVLYLAAESMKAVGGGYVLELSHTGIFRGIAACCGRDGLPEEVAACIGARNLHDMRGACLACGLGEDVAAKLCALLGCGGSEEQKLSLLCSLFPESAECAAAARELSLAVRSLEQGGARAEIDFSLSDDPAYYNGIVFRGYGENFPGAVLTGGRYDNLVKKFGAGSGGIGFALCADAFEGARRQFDADVLLLYGEGADPQKVLLRARRIAAEGESVYAAKRVPEAMKFARTEKMD